jgi:predicted polyphosphate/ATP-dependent NAD kinase
LTNKCLGLIVNPIAGLGGRVGLKGSDGPEVQQRALQLGAKPLAQERTAGALERLCALPIQLLTPPGEMGETVARRCGLSPRLILTSIPDTPSPRITTCDDTRQAAQAMRAAGVDLILFTGGDGTARDMYDAVGSDYPVLGIPAGVKIHSAVFGLTPRKTGELAADFLSGRHTRLREAEVLDLDERAYREDRIVTRLYGYLKIPYRREYVQNQKVPAPAGDAVQAEAIAAEVVEAMRPGLPYLLGPGTTTRAVAKHLNFPKTLVGVDIITRSAVLAMDVGERQILEMLEKRPLGMIITPTGGQGFLFGRGNQPLSPEVIRRVGRDNILVICPTSKIAALRGQPLHVDSGDPSVNRMLSGYLEVITGYREKLIYRVSA